MKQQYEVLQQYVTTKKAGLREGACRHVGSRIANLGGVMVVRDKKGVTCKVVHLTMERRMRMDQSLEGYTYLIIETRIIEDTTHTSAFS